MKKIIITVIMFSIVGIMTAQNDVSNIRVSQHEGMLYVTYDLATRANIETFVSFDDGVTYKGPLKQVSGAIGKGISPEKDQTFIWNIVKEIGYVDYPNAVIKIVADAKSSKSNFSGKISSTNEDARYCVPKRAFGLDLGIGSMSHDGGEKITGFDLGLRSVRHPIPYLGIDIFKFNNKFGSKELDGISYFSYNAQLMTGLRGNTPAFFKCMSGYIAFRLGYGGIYEKYKWGDDDSFNAFGNGFCYEFEIGLNITRTFFIAYSYNHQGGKISMSEDDQKFPLDMGYKALRIGFNFGKK